MTVKRLQDMGTVSQVGVEGQSGFVEADEPHILVQVDRTPAAWRVQGVAQNEFEISVSWRPAGTSRWTFMGGFTTLRLDLQGPGGVTVPFSYMWLNHPEPGTRIEVKADISSRVPLPVIWSLWSGDARLTI